MAYQVERLLEERSNRILGLAPGLAGAIWQGAAWQAAVAVGVGTLLGISALAAQSLPSPWSPLLVLTMLCPFAMMVAGDIRRFLLGLIALDIPLQLGTHLNYDLHAGAVGAIGGLSLSVTTGSLVILYALWIADALTLKKPKPRAHVRVSLPLALYVGVATLSMVTARDTTFAFFEVFMLFQSFLLYVYVANTVRSRQEVLFLVSMLLVGVILESLIMLETSRLGPGLALPGIKSSAVTTIGTSGSFLRAGGTLGSPNAAAGYLAMLLAPAIGLLMVRVGPGYKGLAATALGLGGLALITTFSRGGFAAFALSAAVLCVLTWRRGWLSPRVPLTIVVAAALLAFIFHDAITTRLSDEEAAAGRFPLMELAFRMIQDRPVLGIGPNNFGISMKQYATPEFDAMWLYTVHNKYLLVWAETGILGLVSFLLFLATTLRQGWRQWKSDDRFLALVALGFTAAIVGMMVHMMVDIFNDRPQVQLLWLVAALIAAMVRITDHELASQVSLADQAKSRRVGRSDADREAHPAGRWPHGA